MIFNLLYLVSGILLGLGLCLSAMIDPAKVKSFLSVGTSAWNPALIFVLGSAVFVYGAAYQILRRRAKTLSGVNFVVPTSKRVDRRLIVGAVIFGVGWGILGVCPGPALAHLSFPDFNFLGFLACMFLGFVLQKRFT